MVLVICVYFVCIEVDCMRNVGRDDDDVGIFEGSFSIIVFGKVVSDLL